MTRLGVNISMAIVLGWVMFALADLILPAWVALVAAIAVGMLSVSVLRRTVAIGGVVALLAPFGVMLPALALRDVAVTFGAPIPGFSMLEIAVFLMLYTGFLASVFGKVPLELYRYGYAPKPVGLMVLALCAYSFATGNWFLAVVTVTAQSFWTLRLGSSNWFDHMLHVLLWPVALWALTGRVF